MTVSVSNLAAEPSLEAAKGDRTGEPQGVLDEARRAFVVLRDELTRLTAELKHLQNAESNVV